VESIMSPDPLSDLLRILSSGDHAAAERAFADYEPYLRKVVRRQLPARLRAKFDSSDMVQSVWASLLGDVRNANWRFADTAHLRAFLAKVTRNRLIDRLRKHNTAMEREQPLDKTRSEDMPASREPRPSEVAEADELWDKMLALCPPEHHQILELRRQKLSLNEIAERTGLHEGSVRRILRKLSRQLAMEYAVPDSHSGETL
jgi:RNA polymerase sigma factor (sigma-70 family)